MSKQFYQDLPACTVFEQFTDPAVYQPLPDDWVVVVTDIRDSTRAIEDGLYKEVNLIGAASITQTMHCLETQDIPFVFGGDGASLCLPGDDKAAIVRRLSRLQTLAQANFGLTLRVAVIPMGHIRRRGRDVLVAKLAITAGKYIALFRGGGLAEADELAKQPDDRYGIRPAREGLDSLDGLSCRWSPVPSRQGRVVSLLVMARGSEALEIYRQLIERFRHSMGRELNDANPVLDNLAQYKSIAQALREERKYHRSPFSLSFFFRLLDIILAVLIFRHGITAVAPLLNARQYRDAISSHSDYRKFDDTLRLVLDCTVEEQRRITDILEQGRRHGHLYYGLHASDRALMTCFVETTKPGGHLHFIDGGDGGLAMAARQLKNQIGEQ